jgi:hypothetical protein
LNLRPSGYEPDELPGCSTPREGAAAWGRWREGGSGGGWFQGAGPGRKRHPWSGRVGLLPAAFPSLPSVLCLLPAVLWPLCPVAGVGMAWRRPTLPRLGTQYHGRYGVSRPSSGWDRVGHPRLGHQAMPTPEGRRQEGRRQRSEDGRRIELDPAAVAVFWGLDDHAGQRPEAAVSRWFLLSSVFCPLCSGQGMDRLAVPAEDRSQGQQECSCCLLSSVFLLSVPGLRLGQGRARSSD